jgi:deoxycytidine triphosphate deaminase
MSTPEPEDWLRAEGKAADEAAEERHRKYAANDPFPGIPSALLGSSAFLKYIRTTAMIHPFRGWDHEKDEPNKDLVKPASYEMRPGGSFFMFNDKGDLIEQKLAGEADKPYIRLPANSITFVSTEETFRLPNYIAVRFNLRIKHVHRGILLGTGPLIDPGYNRPILIPLHNLTNDDHFISLDEGLIWVEFTKTYPTTDDPLYRAPFGTPALPRNTRAKNFREYLFAASGGVPIRSSITDVKRSAQQAEKKVESFDRRIRNFGLAGIAALILAVGGLLYPTLDLVFTASQQLDATRTEISDLKAEVKDLRDRLPRKPERVPQRPNSRGEAE